MFISLTLGVRHFQKEGDTNPTTSEQPRALLQGKTFSRGCREGGRQPALNPIPDSFSGGGMKRGRK